MKDHLESGAALERLKLVYHKLKVVEGLFEMTLCATVTPTTFIELGKDLYHLKSVADEMASILREVFPEGIEPPVVEEFKSRLSESE